MRTCADADGCPWESLRVALLSALERHRDRGGNQALAVLVDMGGISVYGASRALTSAAAGHRLATFMRAHYPQVLRHYYYSHTTLPLGQRHSLTHTSLAPPSPTRSAPAGFI